MNNYPVCKHWSDDREVCAQGFRCDGTEDTSKCFEPTMVLETGRPKAGHPRFYALIAEAAKLHDQKNADYRSDGDPLANFKRVAAWMALYPKMNWATPYGVALIYSMKQTDAALSLMERGEKGGVETVPTRLQDDYVYKMLARILYEELA